MNEICISYPQKKNVKKRNLLPRELIITHCSKGALVKCDAARIGIMQPAGPAKLQARELAFKTHFV